MNGQAWMDYYAHWRRIKHQTMPWETIRLQQAALAKLPHANQQACVDDAIRNGWVSLHPDNPKYAHAGKPDLDDGRHRDYAADADTPEQLPEWARRAL